MEVEKEDISQVMDLVIRFKEFLEVLVLVAAVVAAVVIILRHRVVLLVLVVMEVLV